MTKATPGEFDDWAGKHAIIFGMLKPEERQMINLWRPIFASCGYTLAELQYATDVIARDPPKYRGEHLERIHTVIGAFRKRKADDEASAMAAIDEYEVCKNCRSTGWVFVPHPRYIVNWEWVMYPGTASKPVAAVTCSCDLGVRISTTHQRKRSIGLEQYEERNPDWKKQMVEQAAAATALCEVVQHTAAVDRQLGKLVGGVASHMDAKQQTRPLSTAQHLRPARDEAVEELEGAARRSRESRPTHQMSLFEEFAT